MTDIEKITEFALMGCKDRMQCALAARAMEYLTEVEKYDIKRKVYDPVLKIIYFHAAREGVEGIFVPVLGTQKLDLVEVKIIQAKLRVHSVNFAICNPSGGVTCYQINAGITGLGT